MEIEENLKSPAISCGNFIRTKHHFILRYKNKESKKMMVDLIMKLIKEHELGDFYIEETNAYNQNKIKYNMHTIASDEKSFDFNIVDKKFTEYL